MHHFHFIVGDIVPLVHKKSIGLPIFICTYYLRKWYSNIIFELNFDMVDVPDFFYFFIFFKSET